ncbi:MAG TPA: FG-GAP-like repeat-containing protein [Puia sp.]|nr:FG-GAP-like repeat-containing protein [Puia sp.]
MPNLYPGILPLFRSGQRLLCLCAVLFFPLLLFAQPSISSVTPLSGPVGTTVTISGNNFSATPSANIVRFGTVTATVTAATATSLTVTVPAGASYKPITVTTGGLTAYSYTPFIVTFSDPGAFTASSFSPAKNFTTGASLPMDITAMDFDGDGLADLAVANGDINTVAVYLNTSTSGSPSFTRQYNVSGPSGAWPQALAAGDLDGDGKPDLVMIDNLGYDFIVFQNTSSPGNISFAQLPPFAEPNTPYWVTMGDFNRDGKPDLAILEPNINTIEVFPNTSSVGSISFGTPVPVYLPNGSNPWAVAVGDFDQDGMPDLAVSDWSSNFVSVFRNKGTAGGSISFGSHIDYAVGNEPTGIAVGDIDGDGLPDIVVANDGDNSLSILRSTSAPGSLSFTVYTHATGVGPYYVAIADLNGDGLPDIASASQNPTAGSVSVLRNASTPGSIVLAANVDYTTDFSPVALNIADLDGNGTPDMAVLNQSGTSPNPDFSVLLNQSPGAPAITSFTPATGGTGTQVTITGVNFTGATAVSFGGVAATSFSIISATTITAIVSAGATGAVQVTTPAGTASRSTFTFGAAATPPVITSFQPTSGTYGDTITIQGTSLTQASSVMFGSVAALSFTILSDTVITAIVGEGASGNVAVIASSDTALLSGFTYIQPPALAVSGFSPASAATGTTITITGSGFLNTPYVTFGGTAASNVHVVNDSVLTATIAGGSTGYVAVQAFNGTDSVSGFTFIASNAPPPPVLTSFAPLTGATGTPITLDGRHLSSVTNVTFGDVPASSFQIVSDSVIIAVVGNGASGEVSVTSGNTGDSLPNFLFATDTTQTTSTGTFQLVTFSASLMSNQPFLQWTTVNDGGIANYAVERGVDGNNFTTIGTLKSKKAGGLGATYTYTDSFPKPGVNYYRIKAQDTAANYYYSTIQAVQLLSMTMPVYPNPVKYGFFLVDLPSITKPSIFRLANTWGMIVQTISVPAGVAQQRINVPGLLPGTYRLSWTDGTQIAYQTILVLYK